MNIIHLVLALPRAFFASSLPFSPVLLFRRLPLVEGFTTLPSHAQPLSSVLKSPLRLAGDRRIAVLGQRRQQRTCQRCCGMQSRKT